MPPTLRPPAARPRRVTIRDVATAASVSTATVSYVLNDTPGQTITEATRRRVREAAVALGYSPHGVARALREGQSRIVLLAVPSMRGGRGLESFVAGMSWALAHGKRVEEAFRWGVAAGTAAVTRTGTQMGDKATAESLFERVTTTPMP